MGDTGTDLLRETGCGDSAPSLQRFMTVQLDLSNRCNLRCRTCHFSSDEVFNGSPVFIPIERIERLAGELFPVTRRLILSCATEPLVSPILSDVLRIARRAGVPYIEFVTNGVLLLGRHLEAILETQVNRIQVSVDGATAATFESIRKGAAYRKVLGNLLLLRRLQDELGAPNPALQLNFVLMRENQHELESFIEICSILGAAADVRHLLTTPFTIASGLGESSLRFSRPLANIYLARAKKRALELMVPLWSFPEPFALSPDEEELYAKLEREVPVLREVPRDFAELRAQIASAPLPSLRDVCIQPPPPERAVDGRAAYAEHRGLDRSALPVIADGASCCPLPYDFIFIDYTGAVKPCPYWNGEAPLGSIDQSGFKEIWTGARFDELRSSHITGSLCASCKACPVIARGSVNTEEAFSVKLAGQKKVA